MSKSPSPGDARLASLYACWLDRRARLDQAAEMPDPAFSALLDDLCCIESRMTRERADSATGVRFKIAVVVTYLSPPRRDLDAWPEIADLLISALQDLDDPSSMGPQIGTGPDFLP
jgi:hypothetical protein